MAQRAERVARHLCAAPCGAGGAAAAAGESGDPEGRGAAAKRAADEQRAALLALLEDKTAEPDRLRVLRELPGPDVLGREEALLAMNRSVLAGRLHDFWHEWVVKSWGGSASGNVCFPTVIVPQGEMPYFDVMVVVSHPSDATRMARTHVRKSKTYGIAFLGAGVLSTRDIQSWKDQREHLSEAFLPVASLSKVFPISQARAQVAVQRLRDMSQGGAAVVELNEFLLYETMAQLQLGLLGESTEFMEQTNVAVRAAFKAALTLGSEQLDAHKKRTAARKVVHGYSNDIVARSTDATGCPVHQGANVEPGAPVRGPLMARIADIGDKKIARDNASTVLFAGHDTTANLLTHLIYYIVSVEDGKWQRLLQAEADAYMAKPDRTMDDFEKLPLLKRVILETLRLSPSVPSGTFREVQFDDTVIGPNGSQVKLSKGQPFVVPVWTLHHNAELWGDDVETFNPNRKWLPEEDWFGSNWRAYAPESYRYCPFAPGPRHCLGRGFALLEARTIMCALLHAFTFELAEPTKSKAGVHEISVNIGTFGPADGMWMFAHPRG